MTHFPVVVMLPEIVAPDDVPHALEAALAPFDENRAVLPYREHTKAELVAVERARLEDYRGSVYAEYIKNPQAYRAENPGAREEHFEYLAEEFPRLLAMDDEQVWAWAVKRYGYLEDGMVDSEGGVWSTSNRQGYWDWWEVGGRWKGWFQLKPGALPPPALSCPEDAPEDPARADSARVRDVRAESIDVPTAHIGLDGAWRKSCRVGWWGATWDEDPHYPRAFFADIAAAPRGTWLVNVDCHI